MSRCFFSYKPTKCARKTNRDLAGGTRIDEAGDGDGKQAAELEARGAAAAGFWTEIYKSALPLWVGAGLVTATGRVLGNVHWVSDTLAGAALAIGLVSVLTHVHRRVF